MSVFEINQYLPVKMTGFMPDSALALLVPAILADDPRHAAAADDLAVAADFLH